jgi:hypothetical protein
LAALPTLRSEVGSAKRSFSTKRVWLTILMSLSIWCSTLPVRMWVVSSTMSRSGPPGTT